ncbi:TM2 domain-containing membrane protein YozV [Planomicrobium stackebrandtii]|uniref:TM2 domain-containing membrane protein YozV n=1 Tax=Planomicrobium stackebrandtii TaxID=253160 RepID=A0ABU0GUE4_9BACL|nr:TM2 domain-containing membrane protein YozV [Planomicrobium stackebrandtii]
MTNCYVHKEALSVGTCVSCGKFICENCNTELKGKNTCKKCVDELFVENLRKMDKLEDTSKAQQPMVFMNAGGGGGAASSSSSGSGDLARDPVYTKSKVVAGLLAILLGTFGVHKFYFGKWIQGILYLIFFWTYIPALLGIIEGIRYLVLSDDDFAQKYDKGYRA